MPSPASAAALRPLALLLVQTLRQRLPARSIASATWQSVTKHGRFN
jgi:hypothetical protein